MSYKIIILGVVALLNLLLGFSIIKRNRLSRFNLYFGLLCISGGVWTALMLTLHLLTFLVGLDWVLRLMVADSAVMFLLYLLFAIEYPYPFPIKTKWLITLPCILIVLAISGFFPVEKLFFDGGRLVEQTILRNYIIFSCFYIVYLLLTFYILFKKFFASSGLQRMQLKYIIISSGITFIIMTFFSVIMPLVNGYFTDWFSPIFTLINFIFISYWIYFKK